MQNKKLTLAMTVTVFVVASMISVGSIQAAPAKKKTKPGTTAPTAKEIKPIVVKGPMKAALLAAKISLIQAIKIANKKVPGRPLRAEAVKVPKSGRALFKSLFYYEVDILTVGDIVKSVYIRYTTGKIFLIKVVKNDNQTGKVYDPNSIKPPVFRKY